MSETSRRDVLRNLALVTTIAGVPAAEAQHVHQMAADDSKSTGGVYKAKALNEHEFETLKKLCEIIVPGASKGGAAEFIDLLASQNPEMASIYTGGIAWMDRESERRYGASWSAAKAEQQTELLDLIAYRKNSTPDLAAGIHFFAWVRRMTVDAYYTSKAGIEEVGFKGNGARAKFEVPAEAIEYAMKRSPFAKA